MAASTILPLSRSSTTGWAAVPGVQRAAHNTARRIMGVCMVLLESSIFTHRESRRPGNVGGWNSVDFRAAAMTAGDRCWRGQKSTPRDPAQIGGLASGGGDEGLHIPAASRTTLDCQSQTPCLPAQTMHFTLVRSRLLLPLPFHLEPDARSPPQTRACRSAGDQLHEPHSQVSTLPSPWGPRRAA
jgi:hypothetical protein